MARMGIKKTVLLIGTALVCFLLGGIVAYLVLENGSEETYIKSLFKNPMGPPHIEGPDGPPPLPTSGQ
ncbi:MAG: hypothetical protein WC519_00620 [Parcubacteria group bacterium]